MCIYMYRQCVRVCMCMFVYIYACVYVCICACMCICVCEYECGHHIKYSFDCESWTVDIWESSSGRDPTLSLPLQLGYFRCRMGCGHVVSCPRMSSWMCSGLLGCHSCCPPLAHTLLLSVRSHRPHLADTLPSWLLWALLSLHGWSCNRKFHIREVF